MITTNPNLLRKLQDPQDDAAWSEFVAIYRPAIQRLLRLKGLAVADAEDVTQSIFLSISKALRERPHDFNRAKFRTWLHRVVRNAALNAMRSTRQDLAIGGTDQFLLVQQIPSNNADAELFEIEFQSEVFNHAANQVKKQSDPITWEAFWRTAVLQEPIELVAASLNKQVGSVYAARSRIVGRIRKAVQTILNSD